MSRSTGAETVGGTASDGALASLRWTAPSAARAVGVEAAARDGGATAAAAIAANTASGTASPSSMRSGAGRPSGRVATMGAATGITGAAAARSAIGAIIDARESSAMFAGASRGWT